jgi:putative ABC transport system substrate-binding protein
MQFDRLRRREFITLLGGAVAWPIVALAQKEPARIGFLGSGAAESSVIFVDAFRQGLRDHGLVEGRDYVIDLHFAEGDYARFSTFATELVHRKSAVIVVTTIRAAQEAKRATSTIPIVMTSLIDPVGQGLIASLARPGANITGLANLADDVMPKLVEILNTVLPTAKVIAILFNPANPANRKVVENTALQAESIGVKLSPVEFKGRDQLPNTFSLLMRQPPSALVVMSDAAIYDLRADISALLLQHRLPSIAYVPEFVDAGALLGYGPPRAPMYRRAADYVKKILDGAKPSDLPVEQPTHVELWVNLKTAKVLGISIPDRVLVRAEKVIE